MLLRILADIEKCLNHEAYIAALSLSLTVPDICCKAEYGGKTSREKYISWYREYVDIYQPKFDSITNDNSELEKDDIPNLTPEMVYSIRCMMLHQGTPNIDFDSISSQNVKIDKLVIEYEKPKKFMRNDSVTIQSTYNHETQTFNKVSSTYYLNLNDLCLRICKGAREYYANNKEKFTFFDYCLVDVDEEISRNQDKINYLLKEMVEINDEVEND